MTTTAKSPVQTCTGCGATEPAECEGHESTSGPVGNVVYCDGSCAVDQRWLCEDCI